LLTSSPQKRYICSVVLTTTKAALIGEEFMTRKEQHIYIPRPTTATKSRAAQAELQIGNLLKFSSIKSATIVEEREGRWIKPHGGMVPDTGI
jgi:hypothetical protein